MKQELLDVSLETNIKKEEGYLKALAYKLSKSQDDAQDLLQDTWVRIIENYPTYDNRNKFRSWASVIMKNIFINNFRSSKRKGISVDIDYAKVCIDDNSRTGYVDKFVYKAINNLPHEMSSVFYLYLKGYAYEEIAHLMSIPLGTVKSRIFCTKKRLQAILKPVYEIDEN